MNTQYLQLLYRYNRWANGEVFTTVFGLRPDQFIQDFKSSYGSIRNTLTHIVWAEWIWLKRWKGMSPKILWEFSEFPDVPALKAKWLEVEKEQAEFVRALSDQDLQRIVAYQNLQDQFWEEPLWQPMAHLVNHSTYHRGQVTTLIRNTTGTSPVPTDFLLYIDNNPAEKSALSS
jgi:uncharacterized damage-inducible protein DinB